MMKIFWILLVGLLIYLVCKLYGWLGEGNTSEKSILRNITITCNAIEISMVGFKDILKKVNDRLERPYGGTTDTPISVENVVSISTIPMGNNIQIVIWYRQEPAKIKKIKPYTSPYVMGGGNKYQDKSYWS